MMRKLYFIVIAILLSFSAQSQDTWDLEKCINYAIQNSVDIKQANLSLEDADVITKLNEQQRLPSLSGSASLQSSFGRSIDAATNEFTTQNTINNSYGLNGGITLYNGGRLNNSIKQSKIDAAALSEDKGSMIATVTLNVVNAYFEALFARDNYGNVEIQLKSINDQIVQMKKLVAAGSRAQFEIYDLEAQQATNEQQVTIAQNRIDLAMLNLKGVMNLDPSTDITLATPPTEQATYTDLDNVGIEDIYTRVAESRPELRALDLRIKSGEVGVDIAQSAFYPNIGAGFNIGSAYSNRFTRPTGFGQEVVESNVLINGDPAVLGVNQPFVTGQERTPYFTQLDQLISYGVGVQVSVPIFNNYQAKGNKQRAQLNLENLKVNKERYIIDLRNILGQFLTDAKASKRNLEAADKVLQARQIAFDNAQKRYELGAINSFDYISIQDQLNTARTDQIIAKYDYMLKVKVLDFYQGYPVSLK